MTLISKADITRQLPSLFQHSFDFGSWAFQELSASHPKIEEWLSTFLQTNTAYAILSHRWLPDGELTFQDMQISSKSTSSLPITIMDQLQLKFQQEGGIEGWDAQGEQNPGLAKIINFCQVALSHECKYVWFDTGCINKASSTELEESIRSMFKWYQNSKICIVHLAKTTNAFNLPKDPWFTRGWTLQELLAPPVIKFYDQSWDSLTSFDNDKNDANERLWNIIEKITSIPQKDLLSFKPGIQDVRQRMTWASKRTTTRIEDMAYCLIGIFNVPLSVAYGEGNMAFYRLQLEIMQRTNDKALFAWDGLPSVHNSMFAEAPVCFSTPLILQITQPDTDYAFTNRGLRISLPYFKVAVRRGAKADGYVLESQEIGTVATITLKSQPRYLKVALLGDIQADPTTSFAILLDFDEGMKRYKRIPMGKVLTVKRPKELHSEQMFII